MKITHKANHKFHLLRKHRKMDAEYNHTNKINADKIAMLKTSSFCLEMNVRSNLVNSDQIAAADSALVEETPRPPRCQSE